MIFRQATLQDLPKLYAFYADCVTSIQQKGLDIWDDLYPSSLLHDDILKHELYLLENEHLQLVGAFALCAENGEKDVVSWTDTQAKAFYLCRLAVHPTYYRQKLATHLIQLALAKSAHLQARYLRLFVVKQNVAAWHLYEQLNFTLVSGIYHQRFESGKVFNEYGFEKATYSCD